MAHDLPDVNEDDHGWAVAAQRAAVIRSLLDGASGRLSGEAVVAAASELGISRASLYRLIARHRVADATEAVRPPRRGRPPRSYSLDRTREIIITEEIEGFYLRPERPRLSDLCERIGARCHEIGAKPPNWRTIHARVRDLDARRKASRRQDTRALTALTPVPGELVAERPLDLVQIDHTRADVFVIDPDRADSVRWP